MFSTPDKIVTQPALLRRCASWRVRQDELVFTHGAFDLLHPVHTTYLEEARALGQRLIVGVYADTLKPELALSQADRCRLLAALMVVDGVVVLEDPSPDDLVAALKPDVVVAPVEEDATPVSPALILEHGLRFVELARPDLQELVALVAKLRG